MELTHQEQVEALIIDLDAALTREKNLRAEYESFKESRVRDTKAFMDEVENLRGMMMVAGVPVNESPAVMLSTLIHSLTTARQTIEQNGEWIRVLQERVAKGLLCPGD